MSTPVTYINKKDLVGKLMEQWKTDMSFDELLNVIASAESIVIDENDILSIQNSYIDENSDSFLDIN